MPARMQGIGEQNNEERSCPSALCSICKPKKPTEKHHVSGLEAKTFSQKHVYRVATYSKGMEMRCSSAEKSWKAGSLPETRASKCSGCSCGSAVRFA
eukprot:m.250979 g.250979  ORF g.250979 m.250979 type:complete len:97 (+) comp17181_c8_seq4:701-991(+)